MKRDNPFLFHVNHLEQGENRFEVESDAAVIGFESHPLTEPLGCLIVLDRTGNRINLHLEIKTSVELECAQCGDIASREIHSSADFTFLPAAEQDETRDDSFASDLEFYIDTIDLKHIVKDTLMLSLPIAPLCRDDCRGLCPKCGANLNSGECGCGTDEKPSPENQGRQEDG